MFFQEFELLTRPTEDLFRYVRISDQYLSYIDYLIDCGADVHFVNSSRYNAITLASIYGNHRIVKYLSECGVDPCVLMRKDRKYPIHYAIMNGHLDVVKVLLDAGVSIETMDPETDKSLLMYAIYHKQVEIVLYLISRGSNVNFNNGSYTPLGMACEHLELSNVNKLKIVKMLLEYGANVNTPEENLRFSPLGRAILFSDIDTVREIMKYNPIYNLHTMGVELLSCSIINDDILEYLIHLGMSVNHPETQSTQWNFRLSKSVEFDTSLILYGMDTRNLSIYNTNLTNFYQRCQDISRVAIIRHTSRNQSVDLSSCE